MVKCAFIPFISVSSENGMYAIMGFGAHAPPMLIVVFLLIKFQGTFWVIWFVSLNPNLIFIYNNYCYGLTVLATRHEFLPLILKCLLKHHCDIWQRWFGYFRLSGERAWSINRTIDSGLEMVDEIAGLRQVYNILLCIQKIKCMCGCA